MVEGRHRSGLHFLGHAVLIALSVLSLQHGVLRTTFGDTAFQVFQWISQPGWDIEAHRYTAILPQALVKLSVLFRPDLRTLLLVASLAHVLVAYGVFVLCAHVWRSPVAAFGCALAAVLCSRLAFYSPVLEANYLLCYPFLWIGHTERYGRSAGTGWTKYGWSVLLLLIPLLVHPTGWMVMLFCTVFVTALGWTERERSWAPIALTIAWPLLSRLAFPPTGYEREKYEAVIDGMKGIDSMVDWGSFDFLVMHTFTVTHTYLPALVVLVLVTAAWYFIGQRALAAVTVSGTGAFILVYLVTFHAGDTAIMLDRGVLPVATILALSASALLVRLPRSAWRTAALCLALLVLFLKVRDVSFASRPFQERANAVDGMLGRAEEQGVAKAVIDCEALWPDGGTVTWALPVEALMRSSIIGPANSRLLICADDPDLPVMRATDELVVLGHHFPLSDRGRRWFTWNREGFRPVSIPRTLDR